MYMAPYADGQGKRPDWERSLFGMDADMIPSKGGREAAILPALMQGATIRPNNSLTHKNGIGKRLRWIKLAVSLPPLILNQQRV